MSHEAIERVKARWVAEGVAIRPGNSPEDLAAFEARYGVALPSAFRDYFAAVDGTGDDYDGGFIRFWPLAEVQPILEYNLWKPGEAPGLVGWFLFADFMINSHCFVIHLTADPADGGPVASDDGDQNRQALSFAAFLERYLADRDRLRLHMPPDEWSSTARDDEVGLP
jgi:hypothetical protein